MRNSADLRRRSLSLLLFICLAFIATLQAAPVNAAPINIHISEPDGPVGSTITLFGEGASERGEVRIYLQSYIFMATTTANSTGHYAVNITVPALPSDTYNIVALDVVTGNTSFQPFTIQPKIVLSSYEGTFNDTVWIEGYGFHSMQLITITFNETDVTLFPPPLLTDPFGSFKTTILVPLMPNGTYPVTADDGTVFSTAQFTVMPKISLSTTSGSPSTLAFVTGSGFAPLSTLSLHFDTIDATTYFPTQTSPNGSFGHDSSPIMFFIPNVVDGDYIVNASDTEENWAIAPFIVPTPKITATPSLTSSHAIVTVTGRGFPPRSSILLLIEEIIVTEFMDLVTQSSKLSANEYGEFEYSFTTPITEPGTYTIDAYVIVEPSELGGGKAIASANLTVVQDPLLVDIKDRIATIIIPDLGLIKTSLAEIDAVLFNIEGNTATINSTLGLIQADIDDIQLRVIAIEGNLAIIETSLGTIEGRIAEIEGTTAVIETQAGTITIDVSNLQTDLSDTKKEVSDVKGIQETTALTLYATLGVGLVAAIGAVILLVMHAQAFRKASS